MPRVRGFLRPGWAATVVAVLHAAGVAYLRAEAEAFRRALAAVAGAEAFRLLYVQKRPAMP